jgi:hypothetical protein
MSAQGFGGAPLTVRVTVDLNAMNQQEQVSWEQHARVSGLKLLVYAALSYLCRGHRR